MHCRIQKVKDIKYSSGEQTTELSGTFFIEITVNQKQVANFKR